MSTTVETREESAVADALALLRPLTLDDFDNLPESLDRYEILQGELIVTPAPRLEHQDLSQEINLVFTVAVRAKRFGKVYAAPVGVRLSMNDIVQPDLLVLSNAKRALIRKNVIDGAPDVVVEILSPSTRRFDLVRKMALYAEAGVPEYWIVDPEKRSILVHQLVNSTYVIAENVDGVASSRIVEGAEINVKELFDAVWWSD